MSDWKSHVRRLFDADAPDNPDADAILQYLRDTVGPAFQELKHEMQAYDAAVRVDVTDTAVRIAFYDGENEAADEVFRYAVHLRTTRVPNFAYPAINVDDDEARRHCAEARVNGDAVEHHDVSGWSEDALIRDVLRAYEEHVYWAQTPSA